MLKVWFSVTRPKTLIASIVPVSVAGSTLNIGSNAFPWVCFLCCLLFSILVQIGTNLANDYFDGVRGTDDYRNNAPKRMVADGLLLPIHVISAATVILFFAFFVGCAALWISQSSPLFLVFGLVCIFLAIGYTGGPFPLAYNGLGDIFVILFFGFGAMEGTKFILSSALLIPWEPDWYTALSLGLLINNLLVVNNYRDYMGDKKVGKKTTVVILGRQFGLSLYICSIIVSTIVTPWISGKSELISITAILGLWVWFKLNKASTKNEFNTVLSFTALIILVHGCLVVYCK